MRFWLYGAVSVLATVTAIIQAVHSGLGSAEFAASSALMVAIFAHLRIEEGDR